MSSLYTRTCPACGAYTSTELSAPTADELADWVEDVAAHQAGHPCFRCARAGIAVPALCGDAHPYHVHTTEHGVETAVTAPCGCGYRRGCAHYPAGTVSTVGMLPCQEPGCGAWVSNPYPPEPMFCSREHADAAGDAAPVASGPVAW